MTPQEIATALGSPERRGDEWVCLCPVHDDHDPSLSITERDGKLLIICRAGCDQTVLFNTLRVRGLLPLPPATSRKRIVGTYDYRDEAGMLLAQKVRYQPKDFRWRRPDPNTGNWIWNKHGVRSVLYRLPELLSAPPGAIFYIVEGEKDVDAGHALGVVATCNPDGGSKRKVGDRKPGKWQDEYNEFLHNRTVAIIPDNDEVGIAHANTVAASIAAVARVRIVNLPGIGPKEDLSDWIAAGGAREQLDQLVAAAPDFEPSSHTDGVAGSGPIAGDEPASPERESQSKALIRLAAAADLYHAPDNTAYADIVINGHRETWPVRNRGFKQWLSHQFWLAKRGAPSSEAMGAALNVIEAMARYDGPEQPVYVRVASHGDVLYLDLADEKWRAVEIGPTGWHVIDAPPVRFRRSAGMRPLPTPEPGDAIADLQSFTNVKEDDFVLLVAWLLAAMRDRGPYPVLVLIGEQGSAKSFVVAVLRRLVDPNASPLRSLPREDRDLFIAATNGHVIAIDNVSSLPPWLSDTLCRLATGGGFATRTLYSDAEETLFDATRPIIVTGIEDFVIRGDLADRAIFLRLEPIPEERRKPEKELWADFTAKAPRILGTLLGCLAQGLRMLPHTQPGQLPRMADFAVWAMACEGALWEPGTFNAAYAANRVDANATVIEGDTVALAVRKLVSEGPWSALTAAELSTGFAKSKQAAAQGVNWAGTASELLEALGKQIGETASHTKTWPKTPRALSGRLRRAAPNLRRVGIAITFDREGHAHSRVITISATVADRAGAPSSAPAASAAATKTRERGNGLAANDLRTRNGGADANTIPTAATVRPTVHSNPLKTEEEGAAGAKIHHFSGGKHVDSPWRGQI